MSIYLDYNASTPVDSRVLEEMINIYKNDYGNPDSRTHDFGSTAKKEVENARSQVAKMLGVKSDEVIFTSGATESNNIALLGLQEYAEKTGKKHIITTSIEHKAILEAAKHLEDRGYEVEYVSPEKSGRVSANSIINCLRPDTLLVSVMHANNETGVVQPVQEIGEELEKRKILFHIDATQTAGKLVEEIQNLKYDMLSLGAHKMNGPQGVGALILKKKKYKFPPVKPLMFGGGQEHGLRPGTVPTALVAGLGKSCEIAAQEYQQNTKENKEIKIMLLKMLEDSGIQYQINGDQSFCMVNTLNISIKGVMSEALMLASKQYCGISNGSACTSHSYEPSYVLRAMGLPEERIDSAIRLSWGPGVDRNVLKKQFNDLLNVAKSIAI
jgi:cysteine desulfurase